MHIARFVSWHTTNNRLVHLYLLPVPQHSKPLTFWLSHTTEKDSISFLLLQCHFSLYDPNLKICFKLFGIWLDTLSICIRTVTKKKKKILQHERNRPGHTGHLFSHLSQLMLAAIRPFQSPRYTNTAQQAKFNCLRDLFRGKAELYMYYILLQLINISSFSFQLCTLHIVNNSVTACCLVEHIPILWHATSLIW